MDSEKTSRSAEDKAADHLELLLKVSGVLASPKPLRESLTELLTEVLQTLGAERGFVVLRDKDGWTSVASHEIKVGKTLEPGSFSRTLVDRVAVDRETALVADTTDSSFSHIPSIILAGIRSILCSPLEWEGEVWGAVYVDNRVRLGMYRETHRQLLSSIAQQASRALHTAWLQSKLQESYATTAFPSQLPESPVAISLTLDQLLYTLQPTSTRAPYREPPVLPEHPTRAYLFGALRVETEDGAREWKSRRDLEIFAYLALHHGRLIAEERLMEIFWPDKDPEKARHSLHNSVTQIRKVLGDRGRSILARQYDGYILGPECDVDLTTFKESCLSGLSLAARSRWDAALSLLHEADALARAPLLEGLENEWVFPERDWIARQLNECHEQLACYFHSRGKHLLAAEGWRRILQHDPCHEGACKGLVISLLALDRRSEAHRAYQAFVHSFETELELPAPFEFEDLLS